MSEIKYQIFISSTYRDLSLARETVIKTILGLYQFPIGMEMFSADDDEQWEVIRETIDSSDFYILIIGHRYGSETKDGMSYTEQEFDYARKQSVPVLSFIRKRDVATTPDQREAAPEKNEKLQAFIEKASSSKMCDYWETEEQLASKVAIALSKIFRKTQRIGWIRGDKAMSAEVSEELARLSRENRELSEELNAYRQKLHERKPGISVEFMSSDSGSFTFKEFTFESQSFAKIEEIPSHLVGYLTKDDLERYNESLPPQEEINNFNKERNAYAQIMNGAFNLSIVVMNGGSSPGNEVIVDIRIPEGLIIMENHDWEEMSEPEINAPQNPLENAQEKFLEDMRCRLNPLSGMRIFGPSGYPGNLPAIKAPIFDLPSAINQTSWIEIDGDQISIRIRKLIHTRKTIFDGLKIVPLRAGDFTIEVKAICEELETTQNSQFVLSVQECNSKETAEDCMG